MTPALALILLEAEGYIELAWDPERSSDPVWRPLDPYHTRTFRERIQPRHAA